MRPLSFCRKAKSPIMPKASRRSFLTAGSRSARNRNLIGSSISLSAWAFPASLSCRRSIPSRFGATDPGHLMSMGSATFMKTGNAREVGYYALARVISAAATVGAALPELQANRFIATGCSKRGMAALIACAGDPRIVAAFPTGWNSGNIPEYTRLKGERWGWNVKPMKTGPAGELFFA